MCGVWVMAQAFFVISNSSEFSTMAQSDVLKHFDTHENVNRGRCCHVDCTKKLTSADKKAFAGPILFARRYDSTEACMIHYKLHLELSKVHTNLSENCAELFQYFLFLAHCVAGDTRQLWRRRKVAQMKT